MDLSKAYDCANHELIIAKLAAYRLSKASLRVAEIASSEKFLSSFNLNEEHVKLDNFRLWTFLWTPNAYRVVTQKIFLSQMLEDTSIFTCQAKCYFDKNVKRCFVW